MKMFEEVITKIYFLWYGVATFSPKLPKTDPKNEETIESIQ